jgi:hypothetical protein
MVTLLVASYLGMPFLIEEDSSLAGGLAVLTLVCLALLLGIRASGQGPWNMRIAVGIVFLVALSVLGELLGLNLFTGGPLQGSLRVPMALLMFLGIKTMLARILKSSRVDADLIFAAIGALVLLAFFWGYVYLFLEQSILREQLFTGSYQPNAALGVDERQIELFYFSIITLTTVGYGDVTPIHPVSRSLAALEGLTGQLYLTVLVASLVSLHVSYSRKDGAPEAD